MATILFIHSFVVVVVVGSGSADGHGFEKGPFVDGVDLSKDMSGHFTLKAKDML